MDGLLDLLNYFQSKQLKIGLAWGMRFGVADLKLKSFSEFNDTQFNYLQNLI